MVRLLRARSFVGGHCRLTRRGLALELQLDGEDLEIVLEEEAARRVTHGVRTARFVLNPSTVPKRWLMESLERAFKAIAEQLESAASVIDAHLPVAAYLGDVNLGSTEL